MQLHHRQRTWTTWLRVLCWLPVLLLAVSGCGSEDDAYAYVAEPPSPALTPLPEPTATSVPPLLLDLPRDLPQPPARRTAVPSGRPATAAETAAYAQALADLRGRPLRSVQRHTAVGGVTWTGAPVFVEDHDPATGVTRRASLREPGVAEVGQLGLPGRSLRRLLGAEGPEAWVVQAGDGRSLQLYAVDPRQRCLDPCALEVSADGEVLLVEDGAVRTAVTLSGGRISGWYSWWEGEPGGEAEAVEESALLLDLAPDAGMAAPPPELVLSAEEHDRRYRRPVADRPVPPAGDGPPG